MTELLGLAGRKFAGKDTFAHLLIEEGERRGVRVVRAAFADKLKVSAARSLGLAPQLTAGECVAMMDLLKEEGGMITVRTANGSGWGVTGREFLQLYGTEAHRDVFGENFWVDACLPVSAGGWLKGYDDADLVVVSDVRFVSEAERVRRLGGRILRIDRELPDDGDQHASEAGLPGEYIYEAVDNNGSIDELRLAAVYWLLRLTDRDRLG